MKPKILIQLDTDPQPSVFDAVVAIDAGAEHLLRHGGVTPADVRDLVYGALFTRGPADLAATAIFIGGSNVTAGEARVRARSRRRSSAHFAFLSCSMPTAPIRRRRPP